ncbi:MAG: hypothetical protein RLZZ609_904 [Cyanobacteriota bacterium]|jgi:hypothetical protein
MRAAKVQSQERCHQAMDSDSAHRDGKNIIKLSNREASLQLDQERRYFFQVNYCRFPILAGASNNSASFIGVTSDTPISSLSLSVLSATNYRADFAFNRFDFTPVPGPLPALGACAAFGFSRKLRGRINAANLN